MAKPAPLYKFPAGVSEVERTPRTYTTTQTGRDSYLARPPAAHEAPSDAKSWSRQTEDALDAYKQGNNIYRAVADQTARTGHDPNAGHHGRHGKPYGTDPKIEVEVAESILESGKSAVLGSPRIVESNQPSLAEEAAASYYATYIEAAAAERDTEQELKARQDLPKDHRMTKMIVKEDIDFFTALLEGHDPPAAAATTTETQTLVRDETEAQRHSQEARAREDDELRRRDEAEAAKADTDFFIMLMQQE
ncbi:hypothetical protein UCDDA912_g00363 [Diaporthe ampelina]|uniref:Uncharacterized protein n=1 Tax=Diaporthe ampelina TaxID=1214573 RepID=A0A0G2G0M8_9PEZI|nr:hypothetical protein UCDDA912_g00363 [Diaporthe ampelina]